MLPTLPAELIHRIIVLSLPSTISLEALPARYALLCSYSLVNRSWTPWAQVELYRHVLLRGEEGALKLAASTEGRDGLLEGVESLRAGGDGYSNVPEALSPLLDRCSRPYELRLDLTCCWLEMLRLVPTLRQLHLRHGGLDLFAEPNLAPFLLPSLSALSLVEVTKERGNWGDLINPQTLPRLHNLSIAIDRTYVGNHPRPARPALSRAEAYDHVLLEAQEPHTPTPLQKLGGACLPSVLPHIPNSLHQLRITAPLDSELDDEGFSVSAVEFDLDALTTALRDPDVRSTSSLARVVVPDMEELCEACGLDLSDMVRELEGVIAGRECGLERAAAEKPNFGDWETYLDEW